MIERTIYFDPNIFSSRFKRQYEEFQRYLKIHMKKLRDKKITSVEYIEKTVDRNFVYKDEWGNEEIIKEKDVIAGTFKVDETKPILIPEGGLF